MPKKKLAYKRRLPNSQTNLDTERDYMGFEAGTSNEEASASFEFVYGEVPARVLQTGGATLAGPIPQVGS